MTSLQKASVFCTAAALALGIGCSRPAPAPAPAPKAAAPDTTDTEARRKAEEDARRRQEEEARLKAEAARKAEAEAAQRAQDDFQKAAEKALKDIHFAYDKYAVADEDKPTLEGIAAFLKPYPQAKLLIEGNCDERGTAEYNLALGDKRARAALDYLKALGVDESRLSTISYGKEKPLCSESNEACWHKNRRAHFVLK